jgi:hypothetical protein
MVANMPARMAFKIMFMSISPSIYHNVEQTSCCRARYFLYYKQ